MSKNKERKQKLNTRVAKYCIIFTVIIGILIGTLGFYIYFQKAMEDYEDYIEIIVNDAEMLINIDDMEECIRTNTKSDLYNETQEYLNSIKTHSDVEFIYIIVPLDKNDTYAVNYVCNAYTEQELIEEGMPPLSLGDPLQDEAVPDFMLDVFNEVMFGASKEIMYKANDAMFGNMLTGIMPLVNSKGKNIALICVDIPMNDVYSTLLYYGLTVFSGMIIVILFFIAILIRVMNKTVITPIKSLADNADDFLRQSHNIPDDPSVLTFKPVTVRKNDEIRVLSESLSNMTKDLTAYMSNLTKVTAEKERVAAELDVAVGIQESMIPKIYPPFPERTEFDIYASVQSSREMNRSFYDFFLIDKNRLCIFIGEVSGRGIPAALLMVITKTMIKNYAQSRYSADKVCAAANKQLSENNESAGMNITSFIGILEIDTGLFTYVNAGHQVPMLKSSGGEFECLKARGCFALGIMDNVPYWQQSVKLSQGDMLYFYSKGVVEAENKKGEQYLAERMAEFLNEMVTKEYDIKVITDNINEELAVYTDGAARREDIAMIMLRYYG